MVSNSLSPTTSSRRAPGAYNVLGVFGMGGLHNTGRTAPNEAGFLSSPDRRRDTPQLGSVGGEEESQNFFFLLTPSYRTHKPTSPYGKVQGSLGRSCWN